MTTPGIEHEGPGHLTLIQGETAQAAPAPIPVGYATIAGTVGAVATFSAAVAASIAEQTPQAVASAITSGVLLLSVVFGRYAQAITRRAPAVAEFAADVIEQVRESIDDPGDQLPGNDEPPSPALLAHSVGAATPADLAERHDG